MSESRFPLICLFLVHLSLIDKRHKELNSVLNIFSQARHYLYEVNFILIT